MHILLTNDDGISSPYLALLCRAAAARGHRVTVSAPAAQQSAKSHAFTLTSPLIAHAHDIAGAQHAWAIAGTPVDACRVGMMNLCDPAPDLVISGINNGWNTGLAVFVSGTVGAAREAAFQGIPALAVSLEPGTPEETIRRFADYVIRAGEKLVRYPFPPLSVCNINLPRRAAEEIRGVRVCGLSLNVYKDNSEARRSPRGQLYFWLSPEIPDDQPTPGSDKDWLEQGYLSVTFLAPEGCDQSAFADFPPAW